MDQIIPFHPMLQDCDCTDLGRASLRLWQYKNAFRSGEDAVALAHFAKKAWRRSQKEHKREPRTILDVGCASGMILTLLLDDFPNSLGFGLEKIERQAALAQFNMRENGIASRTRIIAQDLRAYPSKPWSWGRMELMVCNPPYRKGLPRGGIAESGAGPEEASRYERQLARFDFSMTIADLVQLATVALEEEAYLCVVFPLNRQDDLLCEMEKGKLFLKHWCRLCSSPLHAPKQGLYCFTRWTGKLPEQDEDWCLR